MRIADLRTNYRDEVLDEMTLDVDPLAQFRVWLTDAVAAGMREPNAMALATVDADGTPSVRMVLLKGLEAGAFLFYTNFESRKGRALASEPRCALTFWWDALERQVRIEGRAARVDDAVADAYYASRPRGSRVAAWASPQSRSLPDRATLAQAVATFDASLGEDPARPPHWGGFAVTPEAMEFWQGRASRLHDRFRYERSGSGWVRSRLAP